MSDRLIIQLPFSGFYESLWSGEIDQVAEQEAEHFADERQQEEGIAKELRLSADEFSSILFDVTDYGAAYLDVAKRYVQEFNDIASDETGIALSLEWESMSSPREYNFTTDRLFAHIPIEAVEALFALSASEDHKRLRACIVERFTSRDGFSSFYSNDLDDWLDKSVSEWDHNELGTLLMCLVEREDLDMDIFYAIGEGFYAPHSDAVDWTKFDEKVQELRDEREAELCEDDPDYVPQPVRCDRTIDMFTGREG